MRFVMRHYIASLAKLGSPWRSNRRSGFESRELRVARSSRFESSRRDASRALFRARPPRLGHANAKRRTTESFSPTRLAIFLFFSVFFLLQRRVSPPRQREKHFFSGKDEREKKSKNETEETHEVYLIHTNSSRGTR